MTGTAASSDLPEAPENALPGGPLPGGEGPQFTEEKSRDDSGCLTSDFIQSVAVAVREGDEETALSLTEDLHPADIADLLEQLDQDNRTVFLVMLGDRFEGSALVELDEDVRDNVIEAMPTEQLAGAVAELDTDDAAFVLEDMDETARAEVLAEIPLADRVALQAALNYEDETAGRLMQRDFFAAPAYWSVGQIIDRLRSVEDLPDLFYEVFVIDPSHKVLGSVPLSRFLKAPRENLISDLVGEGEIFTIPVDMDQEEVAYLFEKYNLISAPVVDGHARLVGMITVDDVVEIVHEETHEDMLALGGVDTYQSGISGSLRKTVRSRFSWLAVNLFTAIMASAVISLFDATLEQMVAVAILMPIVASMGGNAGTQTLTVAVRNLATRDLTAANTLRTVGRETAVAAINGIAFAVVMGVLAGLWYSWFAGTGGAVKLGFVLAAAMIINMLCAGLAGILIPLGLQRAGYDPAISSTVFVTTVTDIVGFLSFLGLAALFLV